MEFNPRPKPEAARNREPALMSENDWNHAITAAIPVMGQKPKEALINVRLKIGFVPPRGRST